MSGLPDQEAGRGDASDEISRRHFVLEELCVEFEAKWRPEAKLRARIEDYLGRVRDTQRAELVEELVAIECELRAAHGETPRRNEYHERFPRCRDAVDSAFNSWSDAESDSAGATPHPERLGDYRIVREIGHGGMGVVYEAVQESLGRRVALKTLFAHPLRRGERLARFKREARAVGALHHTNIVEVYGTGQQEGVHYFAMQLVEGKSLRRIIDEQPARETRARYDGLPRPSSTGFSEPSSTACSNTTALEGHRTSHREIAEIGLQVAGALRYAHSRRVLHRDIKPSNLLLDADGTTWVTDFGLAKLELEEGHETSTGDVIGTLRYLPPEAISGHWDERGDIYSLGLTLYELLTLRPAYGQTNCTKLLVDITRGEPLRPRRINPAIPLDLETIVLKATARSPADRYQTAGQMADDLQRWLDGKPIAARPASLAERALKWSRRKPALAALVAVIACVICLGFPTLALLWRQAETARAKAEAARDDAEAVAYASSISLAQSSVEKLNRSEAEKLLNRWNPLADFGRSQSSLTLQVETDGMLDAESQTTSRRGWEWNYLAQQLDTSLMTLAGHTGSVHFVAIRPDDAQIATVGGSEPGDDTSRQFGEVILWDACTGQQQHVLRGHQSAVTGAAYSPDGRRLATISVRDQEHGMIGSINLWDTGTGGLLWQRKLPGGYPWDLLRLHHKPILPGILFSPDGRWLVSWPRPVAAYRADTGEAVWERPGTAVALLPGESRLLIIEAGQAVAYELASGERVERYGDVANPIDIGFAADGKQLSAVLSGSRVRLWNLPSLAKFRDIPTPNIFWGGIAPEGKQLMYGDRLGALHSIPLANEEHGTSRLGHRGSITHGAFTHDGQRLVTASSDGTSRVWSLAGTHWPRTFATDCAYDQLGDIAFANDAERVHYASSRSNSELGGTCGWGSVEGEGQEKRQIEIANYTHWPRSDVAFSHDGQRLAAAAPRTKRQARRVIGYAQCGKANVWDTTTGQVLHTLELGVDEITSVAWSRDDRLLAVATYDEKSAISVFDLDRRGSRDEPDVLFAERSATIDSHRITSLAFAPGTDELAASTKRGIHLLPSEAKLPTKCLEHSASAAFLDYDPAGRRLAAAYKDQRQVRVFDAITGKLLYNADAPRKVACVRFSPNGRRLAMVGYDSLIYLCDAEQGYQLITLAGTDAQVGTVAFTPRVIFSRDGHRIATNDWQGRIRVWEAEPGN